MGPLRVFEEDTQTPLGDGGFWSALSRHRIHPSAAHFGGLNVPLNSLNLTPCSSPAMTGCRDSAALS